MDGQATTSEFKFTAGAECGGDALAVVEHTCLPDPDYRAGVVHSLYYDTLALDSYGEKRAGDFIKTKLRLRWYAAAGSEPAAATTAFLEVKRRVGSGRRKWRRRLVLDGGWLATAALDDPRFVDLQAEAAEALPGAFPSRPWPAVVVSYARRRFLCPETMARVCLDTGIAASRANTSQFPFLAGTDLPDIVLEMKDTDRDVPSWTERLYRMGFRRRSYSKYAECVARLVKEN